MGSFRDWRTHADEWDDVTDVFPTKRIRVYCTSCRENKKEDDVEFLNICEDIEGRDLLTFKCGCGSTEKSLRFG